MVVEPPVRSSVAPEATVNTPPVLVPPELASATVPVSTMMAALLAMAEVMVLVPVPPVSSGVLSFRRRADGLRLEFFHIGKRLVRVG